MNTEVSEKPSKSKSLEKMGIDLVILDTVSQRWRALL